MKRQLSPARLATVTAVAVTALGLAAVPARSAPRLLFGFSDNAPMDVGLQATAPAGAIGAQGYAFTLTWRPGRNGLTAQDARGLATALSAVAKTHHPAVVVKRPHRRGKAKKTKPAPKPVTTGGRVILIVQTFGSGVPLDQAARDDFCAYARSAVASFPSIRDVVIGNEANASYFWRPQYNPDGSSASPAAYEALLARCYDVLHAFRPAINVAAPGTSPAGNDNPYAYSNISHSPTTFIRDLGAAYRASGRTRRIFDTVVHHPYGMVNSERPYLMHPLPNAISEGDWNRLVSTYKGAFAGTRQPVPGRCLHQKPCVPIWYLETGFQTTPLPAAPLYYGFENVPTIPDLAPGQSFSSSTATTPAPDQATQVRDALRLAYCQPYVGAVFNFLIRDDPNLLGYQSGVLWANWQPKRSYGAIKKAVARVNAGRVSCAAPKRVRAVSAQVLQSPTRVVLAWHAAVSPVGVSGYAIYRDRRLLATTPDLGYVDQTAASGTSYSYTVRAYDAAGKRSRQARAVAVAVP